MWPVKIVDSDLPSYLVPIKHAWSSDLFGVPQTMTPRPNMLGLSREHVYYRSPIPRTPAPARLVWYVTDAPRGGVGLQQSHAHAWMNPSSTSRQPFTSGSSTLEYGDKNRSLTLRAVV